VYFVEESHFFSVVAVNAPKGTSPDVSIAVLHHSLYATVIQTLLNPNFGKKNGWLTYYCPRKEEKQANKYLNPF
jgi:hypothetical protein